MKKTKHTNKKIIQHLGNDAALFNVTEHKGVKMFHCILPDKYSSPEGNHILHENIYSLFLEIMKRTDWELSKFVSVDKEVGNIFGRVFDTFGKSLEILESNKPVMTTEQMGCYETRK